MGFATSHVGRHSAPHGAGQVPQRRHDVAERAGHPDGLLSRGDGCGHRLGDRGRRGCQGGGIASLGHGRVDEARPHDDDPDTGGDQRVGEALGEGVEARLGRAVDEVRAAGALARPPSSAPRSCRAPAPRGGERRAATWTPARRSWSPPARPRPRDRPRGVIARPARRMRAPRSRCRSPTRPTPPSPHRRGRRCRWRPNGWWSRRLRRPAAVRPPVPWPRSCARRGRRCDSRRAPSARRSPPRCRTTRRARGAIGRRPARFARRERVVAAARPPLRLARRDDRPVGRAGASVVAS